MEKREINVLGLFGFALLVLFAFLEIVAASSFTLPSGREDGKPFQIMMSESVSGGSGDMQYTLTLQEIRKEVALLSLNVSGKKIRIIVEPGRSLPLDIDFDGKIDVTLTIQSIGVEGIDLVLALDSGKRAWYTGQEYTGAKRFYLWAIVGVVVFAIIAILIAWKKLSKDSN